jgi:starch phosphorylase
MTVAIDPVCGMPISPSEGLHLDHEGRSLSFCSEFCRGAFLENSERYSGQSPLVRRGNGRPSRLIAYFSMEVGVDEGMPTYAGGLGILAGDTLRAFADLEVPVIGVTLLHRKGYLEQSLDAQGSQREAPVHWDPSTLLKLLPARVQVRLDGRPVIVQAWQFDLVGATGFAVPLLFLDTALPENAAEDRELTSCLYGGDDRYRLAQEALLGIGGLRMLRALGHAGLTRFHMNEGHSALMAVELLREGMSPDLDFASVRDRCVFTTHTPVAAGHDQFDYGLVREVLGDVLPSSALRMLAGRDRLNMTLLALNLSRYVNGVAKKHTLVSQEMFPGYPIHSITNGVHSGLWTSPHFAALYDRHIPGWTTDPFSLRHAMGIPDDELWEAHRAAKKDLLDEANARTGLGFAPEALTLGFARRATPYKRPDLLFADLGRLEEIARKVGPLQILFAGKAHPRDEPGKELIRSVVRHARELKGRIRVAWLENYDIRLARLFTSGVDLWLNTPLPPLEASGTSGMKAAHNGVPSLSVLDGWWIEGCIEGVTGWSIGGAPHDAPGDADDLYRKLKEIIAPMFFKDPARWINVMRHSIAINASHFNAHRMVQQYVTLAYA